jgi:transposase-like protein
VAQAEGVNSHQVFNWRPLYRDGGLRAPEERSMALLPVVVSAENMSGIAPQEEAGRQ